MRCRLFEADAVSFEKLAVLTRIAVDRVDDAVASAFAEGQLRRIRHARYRLLVVAPDGLSVDENDEPLACEACFLRRSFIEIDDGGLFAVRALTLGRQHHNPEEAFLPEYLELLLDRHILMLGYGEPQIEPRALIPSLKNVLRNGAGRIFGHFLAAFGRDRPAHTCK